MTTAAAVTDEQIHAAQAGDQEAMWQIVSAYDPMLKSVVRSVAPAAGQDAAEDLLQEARVVLIQHIKDYATSSSSAQLHSYAYRAVRRAVAEEWLRSTTSLSVEPSAALAVKRALWTTEGDVEGAWMIVSTDPDPKRRMSREGFVSVCEALAEALCLDSPMGGNHVDGPSSSGAAQTLAETIPDTLSDFTDSTERRELARWLLTQIPQRQAFALRAYYGIGMTAQTDAEVADDLQVRLTKNVRLLRHRGIASAQQVARGHHVRLAA